MDINEELSSAIFNVGRLVREKIYSSDCSTGFTQTEIEVLKFLEDSKNTKMKAIADYLHIKPSSATPVIENLVKKGSLKRIINKNDRRAVYITLTPKGLKSIQEKHKIIHKIINKVFSALSDKDKKNLIKIFEKIHE